VLRINVEPSFSIEISIIDFYLLPLRFFVQIKMARMPNKLEGRKRCNVGRRMTI
jgi:hypothetical protein